MNRAEELSAAQTALAGSLGEAPALGGAALAGDAWLEVPAARWRDACRAARELPALGFDFLRCLTGVDRPEAGRIEVVAHLFSYRHRRALTLKTSVPRDTPELDSVAGVWPAADWHERELWDLLGVRLRGHPDLRRLLLPEDWPGHPLRKDWQEPDHYRGIPTRRAAPQTAGELAKQTYVAVRGVPSAAPKAGPASPGEDG